MLDFANNYLKINGEESTHYGLFLSGEATYSAPRRKRQTINVPGRNGDLIIEENAYENTPHIYKKALIINYENNIEKIRNWFASMPGYFRLEDSFHPREFYLASYEGPFEPEVWRDGSVAKFDLEFNRKPQRFLKSGEDPIEFTSNGSINNPTLHTSKPLLRIYGNGTVGIGANNLLINGITDYVDVDCENMNAYKGTTNLNANVACTNYPMLKPGINNVSFSGGITKVIITPRWWIL